MLQVKTPEETLSIINTQFSPRLDAAETIPLDAAVGRILAGDITANEYVPGFDRSTVDGYAVRSEDTFGCSESLPAILELCGEVLMGEEPEFSLQPGKCCSIPTGGALPKGSDSVVMIEYCEDYGDGTVGIGKSAAPGQNVIFRGDDVFPGKAVLPAGHSLKAQDIGALAAMGISSVNVLRKLRVGIISTGDELVEADKTPKAGQIRDVNLPMLFAAMTEFGCEAVGYGIVKDSEAVLLAAVREALASCDAVILSGGSSVGTRDASAHVIEQCGEILLHGIAVKPGKPTILGIADGKPIIGLPGHPAAAFFITRIFVLPLLGRLMGTEVRRAATTAILTENVEANHGRAQIVACRLEKNDSETYARPIHSKSGLITSLAGADGYFVISRDCEGLAKGSAVSVILC